MPAQPLDPPLTPKRLEEIAAVVVGPIAGRGAIRAVTLPGGASLRRYHRLTIAGGTPASLLVMELGPERGPEEVTKGESSNELPFINVLRYLARGGIGVPHLYYYDEPRGLLYIEDLGDVTLEACVQGAAPPVQRRYYQAAISELVRMQRYTQDNMLNCIAFTRGFDRELLRWELDHFREWGLEIGSGAQLSGAERAELDRQFDRIADRLAAEPRGFVHRDFQSRNLMVQESRGEVRIRLIDFQDALLGPRAYDLVALLRDSYVELSPTVCAELIGDYVGAVGLDRPAFQELFDLQTVQRKLKDAGRFVYIDRIKKNSSFLKHIPSSHRYVATALSRLPELSSLSDLLTKHLHFPRAS